MWVVRGTQGAEDSEHPPVYCARSPNHHRSDRSAFTAPRQVPSHGGWAIVEPVRWPSASGSEALFPTFRVLPPSVEPDSAASRLFAGPGASVWQTRQGGLPLDVRAPPVGGPRGFQRACMGFSRASWISQSIPRGPGGVAAREIVRPTMPPTPRLHHAEIRRSP